jgi:uncharacterized protein YggE
MKNFISVTIAILLVTGWNTHLYSENHSLQKEKTKEISKLIVTGKGTVLKSPDRLNLTVGVVSYDPNVKKAMNINAEKMANVISSLKQLGLTDKEMKTGTYSVVPQDTPTPRNPPADWQPSIVGYQVENSLVIRTLNLRLTQDIIDTAGDHGANQMSQLGFDLSDEQSANEEAIQLAIKQARAYAEAASATANVGLGEIVELSINQPSGNSPALNRVYAFAAKEVMTPISPGDIEVSASVTITFSLKGQALP